MTVRSVLRRLSLPLALLMLGMPLRDARAQTRVPLSSRGAGPGEIRGRVAESSTNAPVTSGSITVVRPADGATAGASLPNADGSFRIDGLPLGRYTVRVRALGFSPVTRDDVTVTASKHSVDLGTITLTRVAAKLDAAVVSAERDEVQLAPDRNTYSAKNMATAAGGTAIDVLRNVPSVEVDGSNNVSLRGSTSVTVQINGRTSPLKGDQLANFLAQLPASTIKNVEVATNPSAKEDPEGTAGIINIVLDQEAEFPLSGGLNLGASTNGQRSGSGNIGRQQGAFTWFLSYGVFGGHQTNDGWTHQTNLAIETPAFVHSRIDGSSSPLWQNLSARTEYRFTPHDALSADFMASGGHFSNSNASYFSDLDASGGVIGLFDQFNDGASSNSNLDYDFAYRRTGDPKSRTFSTELDLTQNSVRGSTDIFGAVHSGSAATGALAIPTERDRTHNSFPRVMYQIDFTQPWSTGTKLETGLKELVRHTANDFSALYLDDSTGDFVVSAARTTAFDYREQIGSGYAVLSQRLGKAQAQGGLRLEEAVTRLGLPNAAPDSQRFDNRYASVYPSGILSYNFTQTRQMKISYSRRVSRPYPSQLSPIEYRQDAHTIFKGNPDLFPDYTNAFELSFQDSHGWGTLQLNPYLRRTDNAVRFIQTTDTTGMTTGTFANVASSTVTGADLNLTVRAGPLTLFPGASLYHYSSDASNLATNLSTNTTAWNVRINGTWKVNKKLDFQAFANYRPAMATEGGRQGAMSFVNLALRQKLWNDQGSISVRVTDPFNTMHFGSITTNPEVIQAMQRNFGMRGVYIGFSRNFGKQIKLRPRQADDQPPAQPGTPP